MIFLSLRNVLICLVSAAFCLTAQAADLMTLSGKIYKNVDLRKASAGCVQILHDEGVAAVELNDLPESFIAALSNRQRTDLLNLIDLTLKDGTVYRKCSISGMGGGFIEITHVDGSCKIAFAALPEKIQKVFSRKQLEKIKASKQTAARRRSGSTFDPGGDVTTDGKKIHTGPRGGRYYINDNGRKVYLRKNPAAKDVGQP